MNYYVNQAIANAANPPKLNMANVFRPNLVPSIPHPANNRLNNFDRLTPDHNSHHQLKQVPAPGSVNGEKSMSPFLEPPKARPQPQPRIPSVQWANPNGFIPSQLTNGPLLSAKLSNAKDVSIVVTPRGQMPNTIPMTVRPAFLRPKGVTTTTTKRPFLVRTDINFCQAFLKNCTT